MRLLAWLLLGLVTLAVMKAALHVIASFAWAVVLVGFVVVPRRMMAITFFVLLLAAFIAHPVAGMVLGTAAVLTGCLAKR